MMLIADEQCLYHFRQNLENENLEELSDSFNEPLQNFFNDGVPLTMDRDLLHIVDQENTKYIVKYIDTIGTEVIFIGPGTKSRKLKFINAN